MLLPGFNFFFEICFNTNVNLYLSVLHRNEVIYLDKYPFLTDVDIAVTLKN